MKKYRIRDDPYELDGNPACQWLDLPSKEFCAMNGIRATYTPVSMLTINAINLDLANMDFEEMATDPEDVDEEKMRKMIESLRQFHVCSFFHVHTYGRESNSIS